MKKYILLTFFAIIFSISATCQFQNNEDKIDLSGYIVPIQVGTGYINYATTNILIFNSATQTNTSVASTTFTLTKTEINTLQSLANSAASNNHVTRQYITALEMKYGISNNTMNLYVRPIYVTQSKPLSSIPNSFYYMAPANEELLSQNPYFLLSPTGLGPADFSQNVIDGFNYQATILINHYYGDKGKFNSLSYSNDDTTITYSFQELDAVMNANLMPDNRPDTSLILQNIGYPTHVNAPPSSGSPNGGWYPILKHGMLLVPSFSEANPHAQSFPANKYADLGNMCPPECPGIGNGTVFTLIK